MEERHDFILVNVWTTNVGHVSITIDPSKDDELITDDTQLLRSYLSLWPGEQAEKNKGIWTNKSARWVRGYLADAVQESICEDLRSSAMRIIKETGEIIIDINKQPRCILLKDHNELTEAYQKLENSTPNTYKLVKFARNNLRDFEFVDRNVKLLGTDFIFNHIFLIRLEHAFRISLRCVEGGLDKRQLVSEFKSLMNKTTSWRMVGSTLFSQSKAPAKDNTQSAESCSSAAFQVLKASGLYKCYSSPEASSATSKTSIVTTPQHVLEMAYRAKEYEIQKFDEQILFKSETPIETIREFLGIKNAIQLK